jgi:hypothetical protein
MGIRIAERARITPEFKEAVVMLSIARLKQIREEMEYKTGLQLTYYKRDMGPNIVRLGKLAKNPDGELDMIITRLRGLPYEAFETICHSAIHPEVMFLSGTTKEIEIRFKNEIYHMGKYLVRIPFSKIIGTANRPGGVRVEPVAGDAWHFIPLNNLYNSNSSYRTPHHYGVWPEYSSTCWGEFSPMINDLTRSADIPELFRTISIYLSRYDSHSPLHGRLEEGDFPWARITPAGAKK